MTEGMLFLNAALAHWSCAGNRELVFRPAHHQRDSGRWGHPFLIKDHPYSERPNYATSLPSTGLGLLFVLHTQHLCHGALRGFEQPQLIFPL